MKSEQKKTTNLPSEDNSVHLEGVVHSCVLSEKGDGELAALMKVCTMGKDTDQDGREILTRMYHRVSVDSANADMLRKIDRDCKENMESFLAGEDPTTAIPVFVSLDGRIADSERLGPHIEVNGAIRRRNVLIIGENNIASIRGTVRETSHTSTMAKLLVELREKGTKGAVIPVMVSRKDNPDVWEAVAEHKIGRRATAIGKGPIVSRLYGDSQGSRFILSVIGNTIRIDQRLRQTADKTAGPTI